jgi:hypothetical protein
MLGGEMMITVSGFLFNFFHDLFVRSSCPGNFIALRYAGNNLMEDEESKSFCFFHKALILFKDNILSFSR